VHPAVALWLWCKPSWKGGWEYKKDKAVLERMWKELEERFRNSLPSSGSSLSALDFNPKNDDKLDSFVAWLLGVLWCRESDKVILLGNRKTGSMLLPNVEGLEEQFLEFLQAD
jgi:predicted RNase H-like nuclease